MSRYDLGSGKKVLRTREEVSLGKFHKVVAKRYGRDGVLGLDDGREVYGVSPGTRVSLNTQHQPFFLGLPANSTSTSVHSTDVFLTPHCQPSSVASYHCSTMSADIVVRYAAENLSYATAGKGGSWSSQRKTV